MTRAAASSMARGNPSRRRQIAATLGAVRAESRNDASTARARSTKRRTAALLAQRRGVEWRLLGWQGQRLDRELLLALEAQRHPAGGQHLHGRTGRQHRGQEGGRLGHDVLAVVQQQQLLPGPQMLGDPFCQRGVDGRHQPDRAGHGGRHQRRIGKRRQVDPSVL